MSSIPGVRKSPWRREWLPTLVSLPGKSHGQRSLAGVQFMGLQKSRTRLNNNKEEILPKLTTQVSCWRQTRAICYGGCGGSSCWNWKMLRCIRKPTGQGLVKKRVQKSLSLVKEKIFVGDRTMAGIQVKKYASAHCRAFLQRALEASTERRKVLSAWCPFSRLQLC